MKVLLLILLISCEQATTSEETDYSEAPRIEIGSLYTLNGNDYEVVQEKDYDSYTQVFSLVKRDSNGLIDYKETVRTKVKLRDLTEQETNNSITRYIDGALKGGQTIFVNVTGTNEYWRCVEKK